MKINLSVYELWFWRIGIVVALFFTIVNYMDNRQQDYLIFKTIDQMETTTNQITSILESIGNLSSALATDQQAIIKILKKQ